MSFIRYYTTENEVFNKHKKELVDKHVKVIKNAYLENIEIGEKDYSDNNDNTIENLNLNTKKYSDTVERNLESFISTYKKLVESSSQLCTGNKFKEFQKFISIYEKIEHVVTRKQIVYLKDIDPANTPLSERGDYILSYEYYINTNKKMTSREWNALKNREEDEKNYALYLYMNVNSEVRMMFDFMYDNGIDITASNMLVMMSFYLKPLFELIEFEEEYDEEFYNSSRFLNFVIMQLLFEKIERVCEKQNIKNPNNTITPQDKFLRMANLSNHYIYTFVVHTDDVIDFIYNTDVDDALADIPIEMVVKTMFTYKDYFAMYEDKEVIENKELSEGKSSILEFGSYFEFSKTTADNPMSFQRGHNFIIKEMKKIDTQK